MPSVHSDYSPSASARWLACSGTLTATPEDVKIHEEHQDTTAADRGTLGHTIVEYVRGGRKDEALALRDDPLYDEELEDDIGFCLSWIEDNFPKGHASELRLESGLIEGFGGTIDLLHVEDFLVWIADMKFGRIEVEAKDNTQLLCYLLLCYERFPDAKVFRATILQGGEAKTVEYTRDDLEQFFQRVLRATIETYWKAGDHCQYCPMRYRCTTAAAYVFDNVDGPPVEHIPPNPTPDQVDDLVRVAKAAKLGKDIYEVAAKVLKDYHAEGVNLGGEAKVTTTKKRKWNDHAEEVLLIELGDQIYTKKLKSPAQIEKIAPSGDYENLIDTTSTKVLRLGKVAPEFD